MRYCSKRNSFQSRCPWKIAPGKVRDLPESRIIECEDCKNIAYDSSALSSINYAKGSMHQHPDGIPSKPTKPTNYNSRRLIVLQELKREYGLKTLLDFGSGNGDFANAAKDAGFDVTCYEIDTTIAKSPFYESIKLFHSFDEVSTTEYDLVTLFHVIEHVDDPRKILSEAHQILNSKGLLIIETPNSQDALTSKFRIKSYTDWIYWSHHPLLYSQDGLMATISQNGFKVRSSQLMQRYELDNHLGWIIDGTPGGHLRYEQEVSAELKKKYAEKLREDGLSDTLFLVAEKV